MSATDYRKLVMTNDGNRWIGVECADGEHAVLMIDAMTGFSPKLDIDDTNALIDALVEAVEVMKT
jgi:hypothetical protein